MLLCINNYFWAFQIKIFYFDIFLKQYANFFIPIFYILQILVWIKSVNVLSNLIYFMESLIIYLVGKCFVFKQQNYFMNRNTGAFSERINIALLAAWGRGKSSVTDTLIDILQKRNGSEYKYLYRRKNENQKDHIIMTIEGKHLNIDAISQKEVKEIGSKILGDF